MEVELESERQQGAHDAGGAPWGEGAPPTLVDRVWSHGLDSFANIFNIFQK